MFKIVKDVNVPIGEIVSYLIEKGYLTDEFELGNIDYAGVVKPVEFNKLNNKILNSNVDMMGSLKISVTADLNLNNYIKKNEIDKYIDSQNKEESNDKKVDSEKYNSETKMSIKSFYEVLLDTIKEQELRKGGR